MKKRVCLMLTLCLAGGNAFADTLIMKSGERKQGKVIEKSATSVIFQDEQGVTDIPRSEIAKVDQILEAELDPNRRYGSLAIIPDEKPGWKKFVEDLSVKVKDAVSGASKPSEEAAPAAPSATGEATPSDKLSFASVAEKIKAWLGRNSETTPNRAKTWMDKFKKKENGAV